MFSLIRRFFLASKNSSDLVGQTGFVTSASKNGIAHAKIAQQDWEVHCKQALQQGDEVRVQSCNEASLHVNKII